MLRSICFVDAEPDYEEESLVGAFSLSAAFVNVEGKSLVEMLGDAGETFQQRPLPQGHLAVQRQV